jgi:hypothetical protein
LSDWTQIGLREGLEVLVVASQPSRELDSLKRLSPAKVTVKTGVDTSIIQRFAPEDKIGGVLIYNGHILTHQAGGVPSQSILRYARERR